MKTEELKTGFWGYKKFSVYQYITALEEEFSAKLVEKEQESRTLLEQERQRVRELEEDLRALRQQYEAQKKEQMLIADTLMEAQRYAEEMKAQSQEREQTVRQQLEEALARREQEIRQYDLQLKRLRELFYSMLQEMDASAKEFGGELEDIKSQAPEKTLSVFPCRPELVV